jgi:uncharacterized membrane protein
MVIISIPYFGLDTKMAFLRIKQWVFRLHDGPISTIWITAFFIHVFTSIFTVIAGFTQFSKKFMWKNIHRSMGKIYLIVVLFFAAPSGFIMGLLANGGITSIIAFTLLAILWWYFTFLAYKTVRARDFERHAKYMYYSYALTLSAITLRLWKFCIVNYVYEMPPMDLYRLVAWIGWVPNLVVAFWLVSKKKHMKLLTSKQ